MSLKEKINESIKTAMRAKDQVSLKALRAVKSQILLAETAEKRAAEGELTQEEELALLMRQAKQRKDSMEQFESAGRQDLADAEKLELEVIQQFLPEQMSEEDLEKIIIEIIAEVKAETMKDMGKVMGMATKKLAGKADGKTISKKVKQLLAS